MGTVSLNEQPQRNGKDIFWRGIQTAGEIEKYAAPDKERLFAPRFMQAVFSSLYLIFEALAVEHVLLEEAVEVGVERSGT